MGSLLALRWRRSSSTNMRPSFNAHYLMKHRETCAEYAARFPTSNIIARSICFRQTKRFALLNRAYHYYGKPSLLLSSSIIFRPAPLPCFGLALPRIPGFLPNGAIAWLKS